MKLFKLQIILALACAFIGSNTYSEEIALPKQNILLVVGAEGQAEYGKMFRTWVEQWQSAAEAAQANFEVVGDGDDDESDRDQITTALSQQADVESDLFWLVLIGHGTFDGSSAKFNLRGADVTAGELAEWLAPIRSPTVVINCASSSAPFLNQLSSQGRIVITATKSGYELNFARFGQYLADVITDPQADLDKDDQVSILEAYLTASRRVEEFYDENDRLATEHALLDDNGDGLGTPASWFRGLRATQRANKDAELDGLRAHQVHLVASDREASMPQKLRLRRNALELELEAIREQKPNLSEEEYLKQLETPMLKLARIYQSIEVPNEDEASDDTQVEASENLSN